MPIVRVLAELFFHRIPTSICTFWRDYSGISLCWFVF